MHAGRQASLVIGAFASTGMIVVASLYIAIPLIPDVAASFGVSRTAGAWMASAFGLPYAAGFLIFAPLSDRYGRKAILVPGLFAFSLATLAVAFSPSFEWLLVLRAVQGISGATFGPVAMAYLGEALSLRLRSTGVAIVAGGFLMAATVGQAYADAVSQIADWRTVVWPMGLAYAIAGLVLWRLMLRTGGTGRTSLTAVYGAMPGILARRRVRGVYIGAGLTLFSVVAMYTALGPFLEQRHGLDGEAVPLVRAAATPGLLLTVAFAGSLIRRFGPAHVVAGGMAVAGTGLLAQAAASGSLTVLIALTVIFMAGIAAAVPAQVAFINASVKARGAGQAIYAFTMFVGASAGPLVAEIHALGFEGVVLATGVALAGSAGLFLRTAGRSSSRSPATGAR